jgi:uncharacterized beta-barrel protein YwiB (DUF1934 family)
VIKGAKHSENNDSRPCILHGGGVLPCPGADYRRSHLETVVMMDLINVKKAVMVDIYQTMTFADGDTHIMDAEALGTLYGVVGGMAYLLAFESMIAGENYTWVVKIDGTGLSISTIGQNTQSRLNFQKGQQTLLETFQGGKTLVRQANTRELDVALNENGGIIDVSYDLYSGDTHLGYYSLEFHIR